MLKQSAEAQESTIGKHPLFKILPKEDLDNLCKQSLIGQLNDKEVLIEENLPNHSLFMILKGKARVIMNGTEVALLNNKDIVGEISIARISPPIANVIAKGALEVAIFPAELIHGLMLRHADFATALKKIGMERVYGS